LQFFPNQYFDFTYGSHGAGYLPIPWDPAYLHRWINVVRWMASRYADNPELSMVSADGPTSVSEEMSLPNKTTGDLGLESKNEPPPMSDSDPSSDLDEWIALGYTPQAYEDAWSYVFTKYAALFNRQFISFSIFQGLPINDGEIDDSESLLTLENVLKEGEHDVGAARFVFQGDGLTAVNRSGNSDLVVAQECTISAIGFQTQGPEKKKVDSVATLNNALAHGIAEGTYFVEIYNSLINSELAGHSYQAVLNTASAQIYEHNAAKYGKGGKCSQPRGPVGVGASRR
jgi:hypothetical protein